MSSAEDSPTPPNPLCGSIRLTVPGIIPNKKNSKMLTRGKLITKPEYQARLAEVSRDIESQLRATFRTMFGETATESSFLSWMSCVIFADDCWTVLQEETVRGFKCEPGEERVEIVIERIQ